MGYPLKNWEWWGEVGGTKTSRVTSNNGKIQVYMGNKSRVNFSLVIYKLKDKDSIK